jgi:hypothetical protein
MHDMRHGICGLCGHDEVLKTVPAHRDWSSGKLSLIRLAAVQATLGEMTLYICTKCGYAQWFIEDSDAWLEQAEPYVSRIQGQPGAQALSPAAFDVPIQNVSTAPAPIAPPEPGAEPSGGGEVTYDVRIQSIGDPDLAGAVALKLEELVSIPRNEALRIALEHGFVDRDVEREDAEQIKKSLEEVPGVTVVITQKGAPAAMDPVAAPPESAPAAAPPKPIKTGPPPEPTPTGPPPEIADGVKCSICEKVVPKTDTYFTDDGEVCPDCYRLVFE